MAEFNPEASTSWEKPKDLAIKMNDITNRLDNYFLTSNIGEIYADTINHIERMLIERALEHSFGNQVMAAKILGLNRNTLHTKIKKLNIDVKRFKR